MRPKAIVSWSSGKDAAWALAEARRAGEVEVVGAITTVTSAYGRVSMHGVREALLDRQLEAIGLPGRKVAIPAPCPNEVYERAMAEALAAARAEGVTEVVFGDLFLADLRAWREEKLASVGMRARFPLWGRDTGELARAMIAGGAGATLVCVDPRKVPAALAGRAFDEALLAELPAGVDPCGENGEFHSFAWAGPAFRRPVPVRAGEVVEREGFVFADLLQDSDF
jgi:uncharacterized protein (TIGR00290 family)